jgi:hypothetical protein
MPILHVPVACPCCCMSLLHGNVHAAFPITSILYVHACQSCPCWGFSMHVNAVFSCCIPFRLSVLHISASCTYCMSMVHVHVACPYFMFMLHAHAACSCFMFILHVRASCPCCMSTLHIHVAYPCCMS